MSDESNRDVRAYLRKGEYGRRAPSDPVASLSISRRANRAPRLRDRRLFAKAQRSLQPLTLRRPQTPPLAGCLAVEFAGALAGSFSPSGLVGMDFHGFQATRLPPQVNLKIFYLVFGRARAMSTCSGGREGPIKVTEYFQMGGGCTGPPEVFHAVDGRATIRRTSRFPPFSRILCGVASSAAKA
jgi:hypothetical protein